MNIKLLYKSALIVLLVATCLVAFWRYEVTVVQPHQTALLNSFKNNIISRDQLRDLLRDLKDIRSGVSQISTDTQAIETVNDQLQAALTGIKTADSRLLGGTKKSVDQFDSDVQEFLKISNQLLLYESKTKEFINGFAGYFQSFENGLKRWQKESADAILAQNAVNPIDVSPLVEKIGTLKAIIPELAEFEAKLQEIKVSVDQWVGEINAAPSLEEKQIIFAQKQYLLRFFSNHFNTFDNYVLKMLDGEKVNVTLIADQILSSMAVIEQPLQEKFGALNNAVETQIYMAKMKEQQLRDLKRAGVVGTFVILLGLFSALVIFAMKFEQGFAIFKYQTAKASEDTKELISSLKDHSNLVMNNFEVGQTYKEGLQEVAQGFVDRQINLQNIDQLVRDTDMLVKESRLNFLTIKEEFYSTERVSQEIVQLTSALEGVALQMSVIAERAMLNVANNHQQAIGKQDTIDELKYLSSRIKHAVHCTHDALNARKDTINDAKVKFGLIERHMEQMTDNTRQALKEIAVARLDHSQEVHRINEILDNAKSKSLEIADEITALNKQVSDFSVLTKHLDALHELAVKASSLNAHSLLVDEKQEESVPDAFAANSKKMNDYIQEYFTKVFENGVLKTTADKSEGNGLTEVSSQEPTPRINETVSNS